MRSFISDFETGVRGGHVVGSIVMVYNHETHGADEGITETSHHHRQSILSSLHAHIDAAHCLCALLVRGKAQDITRLEGELKRQKGIMQVKSSYLKTQSVYGITRRNKNVQLGSCSTSLSPRRRII